MKTIIRNFISVVCRFKIAIFLNITGLSIAFAAFILLMMQVNYEWGFAKCHKQAHRIYRVGIQNTERDNQVILSMPLIKAFTSLSPYVENSAIFQYWSDKFSFQIESEGENFDEPIAQISPGYCEVFDFQMVEGDAKAIENPGVILLPESMSKKIFGEDSATGKTLFSGNTVKVVGGVYKDFPGNTVVNNFIYEKLSDSQFNSGWNSYSYQLYVSLTSAAPLTLEHFKEVFEDPNWNWDQRDLRLTNVSDIYFETDAIFDHVEDKGSKKTSFILFSIAFLLIIVAAINYINFSNAIVPMRMRSINTQKVLGCEDWMLRFSILGEAILICLLAFILALLWIKMVSQTWLTVLLSPDIVLENYIPLLLLTLLIALTVGLLAGLYPAFYITSFSPALILKGSFALSPMGRKIRSILVGIQFVTSFGLVITTIFILLQNRYMNYANYGFDTEHVVTVKLNQTFQQNYKTLANQLKSQSTISDVTYASILLAGSDKFEKWTRGYKDRTIEYNVFRVSPNFLEVMDIPVTDGRKFREDDVRLAGGAYIFNETARKQYNLEVGSFVDGFEYFIPDGGEIIGIADNLHFSSFRTAVEPMAFYVIPDQNHHYSFIAYAYIRINQSVAIKTAIQNIEEAFRSVDPKATIEINFYDTVLNNLYKKETLISSLILLFGVVALLISIMGVLGLVIFESECRKKETGLRKIHGATVAQVLMLFNKTYIKILFFSFAFAVPIAYYNVARWLENFAYKIPLYWWVFLLAFVLVSVLTLLTVTFQNWQTANENPANSIKME